MVIAQTLVTCAVVAAGAWLLFQVAGCLLRLLVFGIVAAAVLGVLVR